MSRKHHNLTAIPITHKSWRSPRSIKLMLVVIISIVIITSVLRSPFKLCSQMSLSKVAVQDGRYEDQNSSDCVRGKQNIMLHKVELFQGDIEQNTTKEFHSLLRESPQKAQLESPTLTTMSESEKKQTVVISNWDNRTNLETILPVLLIACNRISVRRSLDQLIAYRSSKDRHPIIVSQDCGHNETRQAIQAYGDQIKFIQHTNLSEIELPVRMKKFVGYYKISRHYAWALNYTFNTLGYDAAIIIEDDLDVSPDLFEYFRALYPILKADETLYCVSGWNDNGKRKFINKAEPERLYRTDFFPGLGWMLTNKTYQEFSAKWPSTFWDDWIRHPDQRKNRACIRPELPRTKTFGKIGVSNGQFYEDHLKHFILNENYVPFTSLNLTYLFKDLYDSLFLRQVYSSDRITVSELLAMDRNSTSKSRTSSQEQKSETLAKCIIYNTTNELKSIARRFGLMPDLKAGVARTAYLGIVSIYFNDVRVYLAPPRDWSGYDELASLYFEEPKSSQLE